MPESVAESIPDVVPESMPEEVDASEREPEPELQPIQTSAKAPRRRCAKARREEGAGRASKGIAR
jgi:hypothetical protein